MKNVDEAETRVSSVKCTGLNFEKMEMSVIAEMNEFERKIELGRNLKTIINKHGFNINGLGRDKKDALHTYELHGKNMDMKEIIWRGWQNDLRRYLDKQCDRKVIWIIGENGNE